MQKSLLHLFHPSSFHAIAIRAIQIPPPQYSSLSSINVIQILVVGVAITSKSVPQVVK